MDELIRLEGVGFRYPGARAPILRDCSLQVRRGDRILIRGRSGSGKSTLLALMAGLAPEHIAGELTGSRKLSYRRKGVVLQNPEAQIVTPAVREELAFALENAGMDPGAIRDRVAATLNALGIADLADRHPLELSGGECQRVSLGAALALRPDILFLDEPTSYLDEESSRRFFAGLEVLAPETAVVIVEHRIDVAARYCTAAYVVDGGGTLAPGDFRLGESGYPLRDARGRCAAASGPAPDAPALELRNLSHRFEAAAADLFSGVDLVLPAGRAAAILGPSGAGKTTLLAKIIRLLPTRDGGVFFSGRDANRLKPRELHAAFMYVPQNPEHLFVADTVREELSASTPPDGAAALALAERFGLAHRLDAHPFGLSEGEKRRLNLSAALASRRRLYLLDEPTYGLDEEAKRLLAADLAALTEAGAAVLFITHDRQFAAANADALYALTPSGLIREARRDRVDIPA